MMLDTVANLGTTKRYAELCKLPPAHIQRVNEASLQKLRPCLSELGVKEQEITKALKSGESDADEVFNRSGNKDLLCQRTREEYK